MRLYTVAVLSLALLVACGGGGGGGGDGSGTNTANTNGSSPTSTAPQPLPSTCDATAIASSVRLSTATYFISPSGNDTTGTGSEVAPWKTLYKATRTVTAPGSIIHVKAGTYLETQQSSLATGVSIEGEGSTSVVQGTVSAMFEPILFLVSPVGTKGNQHITNLKFDGRNLTTRWAVKIEGRSNVVVCGTTVVDFQDNGIIFNGDEKYVTVAPSIWATGNKFYNNVMRNCASYDGYGRGCLNIGGQDGMLIYGNTIIQDQRAAGSNGWCIKGYSEGFLRNVKIFDNILYRVSRVGEEFDFAVELFNLQGGVEFYRNTVQGSFDTNFQSKGSSQYSLWIHDNTFSLPATNSFLQSGVILELDSDGIIIENNTFTNLVNGISFYPRSELVQNITIRNNLFKNIGGNDAGHFIGGFSSGGNTFDVKNFYVYNNTMIGDPTSKIYWGINLGSLGSGHSYDNVQIKNNIVQNTIAAWFVNGSLDKMVNSNIQYNNAFGNGNNNDHNPSYINSPPLAASSVIGNNLKLDPQYANTSTYPLAAGSPLINAGINVGLPFKGAAPDIGYIEF